MYKSKWFETAGQPISWCRFFTNCALQEPPLFHGTQGTIILLTPLHNTKQCDYILGYLMTSFELNMLYSAKNG
jgi:hypothetical protein